MSIESEEDRAVSATHNRLKELEYLNPDRVLEDAINLLTRYNSLDLLSAGIERKGVRDELIKLSGKFTITPPSDQFEIFGSVTIWIEKRFPDEAPLITFTQSNIPASYFEPFLNTKHGTVIFSPYYKWDSQKSTLFELIQCITLNLRQVCLGWVISARDQEDTSYIIPPRLSLPTGFPPVPIANPAKPFDPSPIGGRSAYLNANPIPPPHMFSRPRQALLPSPPRNFMSEHIPYPMPMLPNFPPLFRQTTATTHQDIRNSYVSVVGPAKYPMHQSTVPPSQPSITQIQSSPPQRLVDPPPPPNSPPRTPKKAELQNGISNSSPGQNSELASHNPTVPITARKVKDI